MTTERLKIAIPIFSDENFKNYINALGTLGAAGIIAGKGCDAADYDGLLLPGGWDVNPALYGQEDRACQGVDDLLDDLQLKVLERFLAAGKPVLGVCRGHQLINVYLGGTLIQHLPQSNRHSRDEGSAEDKAHMTRATGGCFLDALYGRAFPVNSSHHQAVDVLGGGLEIVQWSDDGVVEAMRHRTLPVYSVQWHPERMCFANRRDDTVDGSAVIRMFLEECRKKA